jgi:hypothetical protein
MIFDTECVHLHTYLMSVTPDAIRQLLDELEANRRSRRTAWATLQRLRKFLESDGARVCIPDDRNFETEGEAIESGLRRRIEGRETVLTNRTVAIRPIQMDVRPWPHSSCIPLPRCRAGSREEGRLRKRSAEFVSGVGESGGGGGTGIVNALLRLSREMNSP